MGFLTQMEGMPANGHYFYLKIHYNDLIHYVLQFRDTVQEQASAH